MAPRLDIPKAAQVAALILQASGEQRMPYIRLLKLMYMLERASLAERGRPVVGDRVCAMRKGPVLSGVYDLCKGDSDATAWNRWFTTVGNSLELTGKPNFTLLSPWEIYKAHEIVAEYAHLNRWELIDHLHEKLPEWKAHEPDGERVKSIEIPFGEILAAVDRADADEIQADIAARDRLRELLGDDE